MWECALLSVDGEWSVAITQYLADKHASQKKNKRRHLLGSTRRSFKWFTSRHALIFNNEKLPVVQDLHFHYKITDHVSHPVVFGELFVFIIR